jgi:hypothetical protein
MKKKKIEKIEIRQNNLLRLEEALERHEERCNEFRDKLNEIINYLNKEKDKSTYMKLYER